METKICRKCGNELPIENFAKDKAMRDGHKSSCKACENAYQKELRAKRRESGAPMVKDAPKLGDGIIREIEALGLDKIPPRLLIATLRMHGYRGELELVTIQKVRI